MKDGPCGYCRGVRLVGWSGAGPILCPRCCEHNEDVFAVVTQAWREQRTRVVEFEAELAALRESNTALQAAVAVARVAVEKWPGVEHSEFCRGWFVPGFDRTECTCGAWHHEKALAELRRALGLEVGNG